MPATPDPKDHPEAARSTQRSMQDREWKRYQSYLRKLMRQRANLHNKQPLAFKKFYDELQNQENRKTNL